MGKLRWGIEARTLRHCPAQQSPRQQDRIDVGNAIREQRPFAVDAGEPPSGRRLSERQKASRSSAAPSPLAQVRKARGCCPEGKATGAVGRRSAGEACARARQDRPLPGRSAAMRALRSQSRSYRRAGSGACRSRTEADAVLAAVLPWKGGLRSRMMTDRPRAVAASASSAPVMPAPTITTSVRADMVRMCVPSGAGRSVAQSGVPVRRSRCCAVESRSVPIRGDLGAERRFQPCVSSSSWEYHCAAVGGAPSARHLSPADYLARRQRSDTVRPITLRLGTQERQ